MRGRVTELLRPRARKVKILATLGPASSASPEMIRTLMRGGRRRLPDQHEPRRARSREGQAGRGDPRRSRRTLHRPTTIVFDLQGPKLRVGKLQGRLGRARARARCSCSTARRRRATATRVELPHPELFEAVEPGRPAADRRRQGAPEGRCGRRTTRSRPRSRSAARSRNNKGVNVPDVRGADPGADRQGSKRTCSSRWSRAPTGSRCRSSSGRRTSPRRAR